MTMTSPNQIASETLQARNADCSLAVTLTSASDVLHLHYRVSNHGTLPLYLLNRMWNTIRRNSATNTQVFETSSDLANIQIDSTEVLVSKTVVDVPYGMLVEVRQIPCMTRLAPGDDYEETIRLALPLVPYTVYEQNSSPGLRVSRKLRFELGYILGSPHVERIVEPVATSTDTAFYIDAFPAKNQLIIGAGPCLEELSVINKLSTRPPQPIGTGEWTPWG